MRTTIGFLGLTLLAMAGCAAPREEDSACSGTVSSQGTGAVKGCTCWNGYWLVDGEVYTYLYDACNTVIDIRFVYTDRQGFWLLDDLPAGAWYNVTVQKGYTIVGVYYVQVEADETVDLTYLYDDSDYCHDSRGQVYDPA